jgi:hypothetical protein
MLSKPTDPGVIPSYPIPSGDKLYLISHIQADGQPATVSLVRLISITECTTMPWLGLAIQAHDIGRNEPAELPLAHIDALFPDTPESRQCMMCCRNHREAAYGTTKVVEAFQALIASEADAATIPALRLPLFDQLQDQADKVTTLFREANAAQGEQSDEFMAGVRACIGAMMVQSRQLIDTDTIAATILRNGAMIAAELSPAIKAQWLDATKAATELRELRQQLRNYKNHNQQLPEELRWKEDSHGG